MWLGNEVLRRLNRYVRSHPGTSVSSVTNLFVDEALRCQEHPGVTFRPGPTGRRAGLVGGPDIWEVIDTTLTLREHESGLTDDAVVTATAEAIALPDRKVRIAIRYSRPTVTRSTSGSTTTAKPSSSAGTGDSRP